MASHAFLVVIDVTTGWFAVRVVAGLAGDALVLDRPAAAALQAVGVEAHIVEAPNVEQLDIPPRAVTRAAKIGLVFRLEAGGIEYELVRVFFAPSGHKGDVLRAWVVTCFARDADDHLLRREPVFGNRRRVVARETLPGDGIVQEFAVRVFQRTRDLALMPRRDVEASQAVVITDVGLIERAFEPV